MPIDNFNGWSCQLIAENDTWSHARRKRRLAQRLINQFIDHNTKCITTTNDIEHSTKKLIKNTSEDIVEEQTIKELQKTVMKEPLLICNFFAEVIEHEEAKDNDVKIFMVLEKGTGGKNALETFRQYLINRLDIREYFQKPCERPNKKKRKRLKASKIEMNLNQIKNSI